MAVSRPMVIDAPALIAILNMELEATALLACLSQPGDKAMSTVPPPFFSTVPDHGSAGGPAGVEGLDERKRMAVVWKRLYRRPLSASRLKEAVSTGPLSIEAALKPTSSVMITRTFGGPSGAKMPTGKSSSEFTASSSNFPWK
jgi:hypothetical protein